MTPGLQTILYHSSLPVEGVVVKNPTGWKDITISLERDGDFHTLVEYFKGSFMWLGSAMSVIDQIESIDGVNAEIRVVFQISIKINVWETLFDGLLKLDQSEHQYQGSRKNKVLIPVVRNDFWSKFINRLDSPVNLESTTDLDGGTRVAVPKTQILQRFQLINETSRSVFKNPSDPGAITVLRYDLNTNQFGWIDFQENTIQELKTKQSIQPGNNNLLPQPIFVFQLAGEAKISFKIACLAAADITSTDPLVYNTVEVPLASDLKCFYQINNSTPVAATRTQSVAVRPPNTGNVTTYEFVLTQQILSGDSLRIYFRYDGAIPNILTFNVPRPYIFDSFLQITQKTEFAESLADCYLLRQSAESILSKITGRDEVLISTKFQDQYNWNAIFRGKHNRGYTFVQKEMSMSFKEWWDGCEPQFNLCLGYTDENQIYIEDKAHAYNPTPIVNLPNASGLVRKYELEKYYRTIESGFAKWSAESASGMDDPQTKQTRNTPIKLFGSDLKIISRFLAAALAIERSRRNRVEFGKDDRLDEDLMIVSVMPYFGIWQNEFDENFSAVNNLLNSDKRVNIRHTPARILRRWANVINSAFNVSDSITFAKGEGNYDAETTLETTDYEASVAGGLINESGVFTVGSQKLWVPKIWELAQYPMEWATYKTIRANKNNAVGLSRFDSNFAPMHIMNLDFQVFGGSASMTLLQATDVEP